MNPKYAVTFGKLCWHQKPDEPVWRCAKELGHAGDHEDSDGAVTKTWLNLAYPDEFYPGEG